MPSTIVLHQPALASSGRATLHATPAYDAWTGLRRFGGLLLCLGCIALTACMAERACPAGFVRVDGQCVAVEPVVQTLCRDNRDCTDAAAARCAPSGQCVACSQRADCAHLEGTAVCDAGRCVQCTALDAAHCGAFVCDSAAQMCSGQERRSAVICDACVADSQCEQGAVCVDTDTQEAQAGRRCVRLAPASGSCSDSDVGSVTLQATTVDGLQTEVCTLTAGSCSTDIIVL